jgi:ribosome-binding protein aMBF1 (putative translation factor)
MATNIANQDIYGILLPRRCIMKNKRAAPSIDVQGLGERVLLERRRKKWSQAELATKANINRTIIPEIEHGRKPALSIETLGSLALALDMSPNELLGWEEMRHKHNVSD